MGLSWFNVLGFVMLIVALFVNEVVYLNLWHGSNFFLIVAAIVYMSTALWLSFRKA